MSHVHEVKHFIECICSDYTLAIVHRGDGEAIIKKKEKEEIDQ
jgi:hypothetical protein